MLMMLYIRHRACDIPLIPLQVNGAHTCGKGGCFLFGLGASMYGKGRRNMEEGGE